MTARDLFSDLSAPSKPNTSQRVEKHLPFQMVIQLLQGGSFGRLWSSNLGRLLSSPLQENITIQPLYHAGE